MVLTRTSSPWTDLWYNFTRNVFKIPIQLYQTPGVVLHVVDYYPRGFITNFDATDTDRAFICDVNPNIGKDDKWTDWNSLVNKWAFLFLRQHINYRRNVWSKVLVNKLIRLRTYRKHVTMPSATLATYVRLTGTLGWRALNLPMETHTKVGWFHTCAAESNHIV